MATKIVLAQVPGWLIHPSPGRDKLCATLKPSAHSPKLGRAGRVQQTLQLPSAALPFLFGNPFLHTRAPETTQHAWSKSKQGGMRKCVAMSDRLMPLQVQPSQTVVSYILIHTQISSTVASKIGFSTEIIEKKRDSKIPQVKTKTKRSS